MGVGSDLHRCTVQSRLIISHIAHRIHFPPISPAEAACGVIMLIPTLALNLARFVESVP
ncbi:hypothetical protein BDW66DRAFT_141673 [Aspergillus desertorum]